MPCIVLFHIILRNLCDFNLLPQAQGCKNHTIPLKRTSVGDISTEGQSSDGQGSTNRASSQPITSSSQKSNFVASFTSISSSVEELEVFPASVEIQTTQGPSRVSDFGDQTPGPSGATGFQSDISSAQKADQGSTREQTVENIGAMGDQGNRGTRDTTTEKKVPVKSDDVPKFNQEKRDREHASLMENLKNKETKKILIIGEQGVGKSSFVNSAAMSITGQYASLATAGLKGDNVSNVTIDLTRYAPEFYCPESPKSMNADARKNLPVFIDVMGFDDNLSNRLVEANMDPKSEGTDPAMSKFGDHVKSVNSILMEYILRGRIPNDCNLLDFGKMVIHGQLEELEKLDDFQEKEEQKVDAVVMIIPRGCKNLPKKLLNTIKQEAQRRDINVPVFGVMTKMDKVELDGDKKWRDLAREFQAELGIDGNFFVPLINYVYDDLLEDEPETNPNTDVPLLKMLNQILEEKKEKELKEKLEKERKFGWCFYLLIGVIVLLVLAVLGFMVYTKLRSSSLNETFSSPKQDSIPPKKEL
ncbi:hypothetical protein FSP39_007484 [Pinctada imbricata]|uniref:G domain-containing protein n=1 Tax=Pinctada imbricata TaxID=66713 RepID=A0AA88YN00_PINIB|nr:hypothetical protein FSP39_007484 [Pinctada imbricata]